MPDLATVTTTRTAAAGVARIRGEVDCSNAVALFGKFGDILGTDEMLLIVDLSECDYLDSAGIREILMLHRSLAERRQRLVLVLQATGAVHRVLSIVGALDHVAWY